MSNQWISVPVFAAFSIGVALPLALRAPAQTPAPAPVPAAQTGALEVNKLAPEVQSAAKKVFGKLEGCTATQETEDGIQVFELVGKGENGMKLVARVCANGQIASIEREITGDQLPADGRTNLAKQFAGAKLGEIHSVEMHYFTVKLDKGGHPFEVAVGASGVVYSDESDDEGDEEGGESGEEKK